MPKIPFTVSARTAKLIGQENFATAEGAIVELVKNAYDADAKNCLIIVQNHDVFAKNPSLYIIDNGIGMTSEIIKNHWMKIGTDDKLQNYLSEGGRVKTGAKGIGRFALDRLALESKMITISRKPIEKSLWKVKWSDFERLGLAIHEVEADLDNDDKLDLRIELINEFSGFDTLISIIDQIDFHSGTILKVSPLKDNWNEEAISSLFDNLEVLIPPKEQPEFTVYLFTTNNPTLFGIVNSAYYDDYDYKVSAKYTADEKKTINFTVERNELDITKLETSYKEVFNHEMMKKFPYRFEDFKEANYSFAKSLTELSGFDKVDRTLLSQIGEFEFTFYFLKRTLSGKDAKRYPYKNIVSANRKAWLEKFGGVKMFRDDFRVRPYGEDGQDWLGLGNRQASSPGGPGQKIGGYKIGPDQIAGTVAISRIANASFQDKSGREGIQENEAFDLFKNILVEIIAVFERDRNVIMYNLDQLQKKRDKDEEERRKAEEEAARILEEETNSSADGEAFHESENDSKLEDSTKSSSSTAREKLFARTTLGYKQEIEEKDEEIRYLRALASVGLIISSFAHELHSLRQRLTPRADFLAGVLKNYLDIDQLKLVNKEENPFHMIQLIKEEDQKLKQWLEYSLSTLKRDKRTRTNINIGEYFEKFQSSWGNALRQRKVKIILKGTKDVTNTVRAFEIDLDAIFNNLLSNSLTALKGQSNKEITIDWKVVKEAIEITFRDNGVGLDLSYRSEPERIFEYKESSKRDHKGNMIGTGMGLYIVSLVIDDYREADINLLSVDNGFAMRIILPQKKRGDGEA